MTDRRGQLVVLAAATLALALVPMALAYLQLGYHADVQQRTDRTTLADIDRSLNRALVDASDGIPAAYAWDERSAAVTTLRDRLRPSLDALRRAGVESGTAIQISENNSRALAWADDNCPRGTDRAFGSCSADRGIVVQERNGRTHVLALAVDASVTSPDGEREATRVLTAPVGR